MDFDAELERLKNLGFCAKYCDRLKAEYETGSDPDAIRLYVHAIVAVYDDRKEYVDAL